MEYQKGTYLKYDWLVIKQDAGHLCGYVKLWKKHPLEVVLDTDGYDGVDVECHGGITFGRKIKKNESGMIERGFTPGYWIGWDYAHFGDWTLSSFDETDKRWTFDEVIKECYEVIEKLTNKYL